MSNSPDRKIGPLTRRQFLIATAGTVVGGVAIGIGINELRRAAATAPSVAASGITPPPEIPLTPTAVPPIPTLAPRPTDAATAAAVPTVEQQSATSVPATATKNPSPTPPDTATAVATNTVEPTNTPEVKASPTVERPLLRDYGVYNAKVTDPTTKELQDITLADFRGKQPSDSHQVLIVTDGTSPKLYTPIRTGDNSFRLVWSKQQIPAFDVRTEGTNLIYRSLTASNPIDNTLEYKGDGKKLFLSLVTPAAIVSRHMENSNFTVASEENELDIALNKQYGREIPD